MAVLFNSSNPWRPNEFVKFIESRRSSTNIILAQTDQGLAFVKAMGNPEGDQALACEWIGASLAKWFGLPTFEHAILHVPEDVSWTFENGSAVISGPACVTRHEKGHSWGGSVDELQVLANPQDISRLIVFDTWIRNRDRFVPGRKPNLDNVFLSREGHQGRALTLKAMDFTHCFANGSLTRRIANIANVQDNQIYGLFPEFQKFLEADSLKKAIDDLLRITPIIVKQIMETVPREWGLDRETREALAEFLIRRAHSLALRFPTPL